ncbi:hypothetical protein, partial [Sphingobacterium sp. T2]|uniref:hypothetical protein n=1 Tax=Sphingobacterium sp. T2 TaxID=1590596 RepID=UPI001E60EC36
IEYCIEHPSVKGPHSKLYSKYVRKGWIEVAKNRTFLDYLFGKVFPPNIDTEVFILAERLAHLCIHGDVCRRVAIKLVFCRIIYS